MVKPEIDLDDLEAIVEPPERGQLHNYRIDALSTERDSLFVRASHASPPPWLSFVESHVSGDLPPILGASSSGVLLVPGGGRLMAITFGYGRHLIRQEAVVQDFGLKVVLNSIDPTQIKSIDARTFDELTLHTRIGASHDSPLGAFELDNSRDLLRAVTGRSEQGGLGSLSGSSSLAMNQAIELPDLPALAEKLVDLYGETRYKENFEFIDFIRGETDPKIISSLNEKLVVALESRDMTEMHLAIPEAVNWQQISGVRFSFKKKKHDPAADPRISVYRDLREGDITLDRLKSDRVEAISALDETAPPIDKWRVYDCVVFETEFDGHLYVLSGGDWYRIAKSHRDKIEQYVRDIPELDLELPPANPAWSENAYNEAAADAIGALCLDGLPIGAGGVDRVELCDLLTKGGHFVHVKKRGRSSTLSHLFAQGVTSAELLLGDDEFREKAKKLVESEDEDFVSAIPDTPRARDSIRVGYVVLSRGQRPDKPYGLPFFSLVSLKAATERLRNAGLEVYAKVVKEQI